MERVAIHHCYCCCYCCFYSRTVNKELTKDNTKWKCVLWIAKLLPAQTFIIKHLLTVEFFRLFYFFLLCFVLKSRKTARRKLFAMKKYARRIIWRRVLILYEKGTKELKCTKIFDMCDMVKVVLSLCQTIP